MHCLFCGADQPEMLTFRSLLRAADSPGFCRSCRDRLALIGSQNSCQLCGRDLLLLDSGTVHGHICNDCMQWKKSGRNGLYERNHAVYQYNAFIKDVLNQFKFRGDSVLACGFANEMKRSFRRIRKEQRLKWQSGFIRSSGDYIVVPIPLSMKRLAERGFNQAEVLAETLGMPIINALIRVRHEPKQSKKNRRERLIVRDTPFRLENEYASLILGKNVLLIDDIYTTGATMRLAAYALSKGNPLKVDSLTLIHA
ncbi:ComF family protein [Sporolactobacillus shoreicorticis]|uniref:Phosphoribosyltransferase family protein n=1 Tax=Sporolactobacillus shoreicorticis TaxID=1923877 RepID=A0ABW5RYR3_9BACL|nr:phosphoribosyltransferase family protein [Sporolactobacillus shoreicorticis]MCO7124988.1 ComF family protein [Sporolactobacillus shoreicorticis]